MIVVLTDVLIKRFVKNSEQINDTAVRTSYGYLSGGVGIMVNVILCLIKLFIGIYQFFKQLSLFSLCDTVIFILKCDLGT
jgi:hypothetical protein